MRLRSWQRASFSSFLSRSRSCSLLPVLPRHLCLVASQRPPDVSTMSQKPTHVRAACYSALLLRNPWTEHSADYAAPKNADGKSTAPLSEPSRSCVGKQFYLSVCHFAEHCTDANNQSYPFCYVDTQGTVIGLGLLANRTDSELSMFLQLCGSRYLLFSHAPLI